MLGLESNQDCHGHVLSLKVFESRSDRIKGLCTPWGERGDICLNFVVLDGEMYLLS